MNSMPYLLSCLLLFSLACSQPLPGDSPIAPSDYANRIVEDRMLLVLSAPSVHDSYYSSAFQDIVDFQIAYAQSILNKDNVVILVDENTRSYYEAQLPADVLITADVKDIWIRDFSTVNPLQPVQFTYTSASMSRQQSRLVQGSFSQFADIMDIQRSHSDFLIDGGNLVDNYEGRVITTSRFMEDNGLSDLEARQELKSQLGAFQVAILPPDEEELAHADGMVMWLDKQTLLYNNYLADPELKAAVESELRTAFPGIELISVPYFYKANLPGQWEGFSSACGVNLNAVVTYKHIYAPVFNMSHDQAALDIMSENSDKLVVPVQAEGVCAMGGSVRCLTWQLTGQNAGKLIEAARNN